jgi:hypothetical protein
MEMEQRIYAGADVWEVVLKSEGVWDDFKGILNFEVSSKNSTELFPDGFPNGVKGIGAEACFGGAPYVFGSSAFYNYHLKASPSRVMNNHVCQAAFWLSSCMIMSFMMTASASTVFRGFEASVANDTGLPAHGSRSRGIFGLRKIKDGAAGGFTNSSSESRSLAFQTWMQGAKYVC